jgi:hypothetical protein
LFQIHSQKPWVKQYVPKKDDPGIENQVRALSDQVKLISEKLGTVTFDKKFAILGNKRDKKNTKDKPVWVKKEDNLCLVAHTVLKVFDTCLWYLDSGCFKHMIGDKTLLKKIQMDRGGKITYGDGSQYKVIGKCIIQIARLPTSQEVLYVERFKVNLLSFNQFYDNDLVVQFSKNESNVFDRNDKWLIGGERTIDNCYGLSGLTSESQITCNKATVDDSEPWHQSLGHLNYNDLLKIASKEVVRDSPKIDKI